ncbi:MAG: leucyl aminopeptidase [Methylobacteriaceae bacterium]|nr:leucyl aminopeptidase [Methylobacteriaceae bacterium]
MPEHVRIDFGPLAAPKQGTLVALVGEGLRMGEATKAILAPAQEQIATAARAAKFRGKAGATIEILAPQGLAAERLILCGLGGEADRAERNWTKTGGGVMAKLPRSGATTVLFDPAGPEPAEPAAAAAFCLGLRLRAYRFDLYKSKAKKDEEDAAGPTRVTIALAEAGAARKAARAAEAVADGVDLARTLVNEPPNVLNPVEFARRAQGLTKLGVEIETLDRKALDKLGMRALLGVAQGSANEARVVIMRWNGGRKGKPPVAFVGKGVTFDTGGISIKPGAGMEDMKGDMAGAACVVGLMHALAARKAKVNAIGAIGLVENMPDGMAQRPGDIVTSMSGQTIEIINTDAEGRLVLADVLWHVQTKFKPTFMIDLATLTGAILVALAQEHAGLFSNDDELADRLLAAGKATGETCWRMPLGPGYDKMIDSKFADMKNSAGRHGGSSTAAQFLKRFVGETAWAHLDIAGTGMGSPQSDVNQSWGSGWGVRLLDRLVADHYEG